MKNLLRFRRRVRVEQGLCIPQVNAPKEKSTSLMARPTFALTVGALAGVLVYTQADTFITNRLSNVASPIVVATNTSAYQNEALSVGVDSQFDDETFFTSVVEKFNERKETVLVINQPSGLAQVRQGGQMVFSAPIVGSAKKDSWRYVHSGYYLVEAVRPERYSSLEQAYYKNIIELTNTVAVHGPAVQNDGSVSDVESLGIQLSASNAATLRELVGEQTPVLVHNPHSIDTAVTTLVAQGPALSARSHVLFDIDTNTTLSARNSNEQIPIASLTKLMTALVVAESYDLENEIFVPTTAYATTTIPRLAGTNQASVFTLLQLLMLESSNEAAELLAAYMGRDEFVTRMNERAAEIGLENTIFTDPSGLDDGNRSTANEVAELAQYIFDNHRYLLRFTTGELAGTNTRPDDFVGLENYNVVDGINSFVGGKIGETRAAKQTSATFHTVASDTTERTILIVVLGSDARNRDVTTLYNYVTDRFGE